MSTFVDKCAIMPSVKQCGCTISRCEWKVMSLLWRSPLPSSQVCKRCAEEFGWSPSTCKTYLSRLEKKGFVEAEKSGGKFEYRAKRAQGECVEGRARELAEETCGCDQKAMLIRLIDECPLTKKDAEDVKRALEEKIARLEEKEGSCGCGCEGGKNGCGC